MPHREGRFRGAGGVQIYWQAWLPEGPRRAVVALAHGGSEHSGRYEWTGTQLAARGYAVYALDHRGHGRSQGPRAVIDRVGNAVADIRWLVTEIAGGEAQKPFLLGHSVGGFLGLAYATRHEQDLSGLILSAPVAVLEAASPVERLASRVLSVLAPRLGVFAIDSATVSRDPEVVRDYEADPLNHHGKLPARTVAELAAEIARFPESIPGLRLPLLVMVGTGDRLVPPAGAELVYELASSEDKTLKRYDGLYHEILNEPERDDVLTEIAAWLDAHTGGPKRA